LTLKASKTPSKYQKGNSLPPDRQTFAGYLVNRLKKGELETFFDLLNDMSLIRQRRSGLKITIGLIKQEIYRQLPFSRLLNLNYINSETFFDFSL